MSDRVRFVVDKMTMGQGFSLSVTFSQVSIPLFICTLLLPEGQRAKPGNFPGYSLIYTVKIYEHTSSIISITIVKRTIKLNAISRLL